jgi:hypothetical protein
VGGGGGGDSVGTGSSTGASIFGATGFSPLDGAALADTGVTMFSLGDDFSLGFGSALLLPRGGVTFGAANPLPAVGCFTPGSPRAATP